MSKTDLSLRLLAILRFTIPANSSRTLNATEAYDVTPSGITLASAIGKLLDKDVAVKAEAALFPLAPVGVGLTVKATGTGDASGLGAEKATGAGALLAGSTAALTLGSGVKNVAAGAKNVPAGAKKRQYANNNKVSCRTSSGVPNTLSFQGTLSGERLQPSLSKNSKATNPNTIFYGGIPVGTGDYKKWQGKYAVLKINTSTGKCVLRIYDA